MSDHIAVVSDSHGHLVNTCKAVALLNEWSIDQVLHCGDIGSPRIIDLFQRWPTHFVFGNVDRDQQQLRSWIEESGKTCHGEFGELEIQGRRIALLHGHDTRRLQQTINSGSWDLVCYGHTHQRDWRQVGHTWVLNPGALYRARPHSLSIVDLKNWEMHSLTF